MLRVIKGAAILTAMTAAMGSAAYAESAQDMMKSRLGTTEADPVIVETFTRAAKPVTPELRAKALECWKNNVCETGHGKLTVAYADGFGENVWRQVTKMEFIEQALTYPRSARSSTPRPRGDATKAISDLRAYIAQNVDVIVIFADAGRGPLPTVKEATEAGITRRPAQRHLCRRQAGKDFVARHRRGHLQARYRVRQGRRPDNPKKDRRPSSSSAARPGNPLSAAWQKCSAEQEIAKHARPAARSARPTPTGRRRARSRRCRASWPSTTTSMAYIYEYADGFRGGVRAYEARPRSPNVVVALRTDEQGLFCDWEKANDPNFKIFYSIGPELPVPRGAHRGDDEAGRPGRAGGRRHPLQLPPGRQRACATRTCRRTPRCRPASTTTC